MSKDHDIPINVIILPNIENETEEMIQACLDILETLETRQEKEALIRMVASDSRVYTLREILVRDISNKAKILEETQDSDNW